VRRRRCGRLPESDFKVDRDVRHRGSRALPMTRYFVRDSSTDHLISRIAAERADDPATFDAADWSDNASPMLEGDASDDFCRRDDALAQGFRRLDGHTELSLVALIGDGPINSKYRRRIAPLEHRDRLIGKCGGTPHAAQPSNSQAVVPTRKA